MAGYPRVTHPSATKLTRSLPKIWQRLTPFDLHVLSTPPAFILSQDQTLIFKCQRHSCSFVLPVFTGLLFGCVLRFLFELCSEFSLKIQFSVVCIPLEFSGLHYCLFVKEPIRNASYVVYEILRMSYAKCFVCHTRNNSLFSLLHLSDATLI